MPTIYDIDYSKAALQLLPADKRVSGMWAWVKALFAPLQYLHDLLFQSYKIGSTATAYASGTYAKGDRVIYQHAVYESLIGSNTTLPISASWTKVQDNYIGVDERLQYNCQKLVFEYALNKWFATAFRQPPLQSDIYISIPAKTIPVFRSTSGDDTSSSTFSNNSSEYVIDSYSVVPRFNMTINIPVAIYNALDAVSANREPIVRAFADKYVAAGITYNIQTY